MANKKKRARADSAHSARKQPRLSSEKENAEASSVPQQSAFFPVSNSGASSSTDKGAVASPSNRKIKQHRGGKKNAKASKHDSKKKHSNILRDGNGDAAIPKKDNKDTDIAKDEGIIPALQNIINAMKKAEGVATSDGEVSSVMQASKDDLGELKTQLVVKDLEALTATQALAMLTEEYTDWKILTNTVTQIMLNERNDDKLEIKKLSAAVAKLTTEVTRLNTGEPWGVADLFADGEQSEILQLKTKIKKLEEDKEDMLHKLVMFKLAA